VTATTRGAGRPGVAFVLVGLAVFAATAAGLAAMGHPLIAPSGVRLWGGGEDSKHIVDWYTPSHVVHGLLFYFALWLMARRQPLGVRALIALAVEGAWEIIENTPWVIARYRDVTVSVAYAGDTIINSLFDIVAMLVGFFLAARLPVWVTIVLGIGLELLAAGAVRDNLTLNVIMLIYPFDGVLAWQAGG